MSDEQTQANTSEEAAEKKPARRKRTYEEIQAQREEMLAKRAARLAAKTEAKPEPVKEAPAKKPKAEKKPAAPVAKAETVKKEPAAKKSAAAKKAPARKKKAAKKKAGPFRRPEYVTRREFLNWAWLGSLAFLTVQTLGVSVLFLFPRFKAGEFGGIFPLPGSADVILPEVGGAPVPYSNGKFWLTNTEKGIYAIYQVCTHLGCLYAWSAVTSRFECPCHGSKYTLNGAFIEGPAPRSLDRFIITAKDASGNEIAKTPENGGPLVLDELEGVSLEVDTGTRILPPGRVDI